MQDIINSRLEISTPNIYRIASLSRVDVKSISETWIPLAETLFAQVLIPIAIIIQVDFSITCKSRGIWTVGFIMHSLLVRSIQIEVDKEYQESVLMLFSKQANVKMIVLGYVANVVCALSSIIAAFLLSLTWTSIPNLVFESFAVLFLNQLDEFLVSNNDRALYGKFISEYPPPQEHVEFQHSSARFVCLFERLNTCVSFLLKMMRWGAPLLYVSVCSWG